MSPTRSLRAASAIALVVAVAAGTAATAGHVKAGPNLVANAGFEESAFEGNPVVAPGSLAQPLLPTGWSFEGLTVLFDHSPNTYHDGKRGAAISGSLSGPDKTCPAPPTCVDNPTTAIKDQLAPQYTLAPHWRTAASIPVTAGTEYAFTVWVAWAQVTIGEGASMKLRWMSGGSPVSETVFEKRSTADNNLDLPFEQQKHKAKAPDGADGVVVMLGQTDDAWTGQVIYDDVHFGTAAH